MQKIFSTDFTDPSDKFGIFDSYNYQFTKDGLVLTSNLNSETGASQPARFRAFNVPLSINEYAESTIKVPKDINGNGLDFGFWYFNTKHKYGSTSVDKGPFDDTEFDVDEIHNNNHYSTEYAFNQGMLVNVTPCSSNFTNNYHVFTIKWTNDSINYYIDYKSIFSNNIHINEPFMFPTWEIAVPPDGLSDMPKGSIISGDFPSQAIVKNYTIYKL